MPVRLVSAKLPSAPEKRLEAFGRAVFGERWKTALGALVGASTRMICYWSEGHCPADLDAKLLKAANDLIAEQHRCTAVLKDLRSQLEGAVS
jgi:hypothetical protein